MSSAFSSFSGVPKTVFNLLYGSMASGRRDKRDAEACPRMPLTVALCKWLVLKICKHQQTASFEVNWHQVTF